MLTSRENRDRDKDTFEGELKEWKRAFGDNDPRVEAILDFAFASGVVTGFGRTGPNAMVFVEDALRECNSFINSLPGEGNSE